MSWLVSIIIPVYNVEPYLEECILSLLNQTYANTELLFINDASTDKSLGILEQYHLIDNRISIINLKENKGPGYARNIGIENAHGEYILFVDSDDYIDINIVSNLTNCLKLKRMDILIFNGVSFEEKDHKQAEHKYFNLQEGYFKDGKIKPDYRILLADCHSPCLKAYHSSLFKDPNIRFPPSIYGEDVEFWIRCLLQVKRISYVDFIGYHRRYRKGSIMTSGSLKNIRDRMCNLDKLLEICQEDIVLYNYIVSIYIPSVIKKAFDSNNEIFISQMREILKELETKYN
ncbi:glycosyltransferase family 2 protein [Dysgonomonas sp. ZJ709]|uniref:glycosyltransferase family 2 protein n=1 Tax=Dysgonomonas sp. ZJ709 TaxID=2709797 RepID=UPI0013EDAD41|nr:glycosyltransferase family 2 protein [Dysgonomonas sp. ZJ709]